MSKTISIRVDEESFNKYTSLNKEKFKTKFIDLIDKFYLISVNSCKQSVNSCKQQNVNKLNVNKSSNENVNKLYSDSFNPKKVQAQLKTSTYDENVSLDELLKGLEENEK